MSKYNSFSIISTTGDTIDPSTANNQELILSSIEDVMNVLRNMRLLNSSDMTVDFSNVTVTNPDNMTDNNINTYATITASDSKMITCTLTDGVSSDKLYIGIFNKHQCGANPSSIVVSVVFNEALTPMYQTISTCNPNVGASSNTIYTINIPNNMTIKSIDLKFVEDQTIGIGFLGIENPKNVKVLDSKGDIINPATEDTLYYMAKIKHVMEGKRFVASHLWEDIADKDFVYVLLEPDSGVGSLIESVFFNAEGDMIVQVYVDPDISDNGDEITTFNANDTYSGGATMKIYDGPSWNSMGTMIEQTYLSGTKTEMHPVSIFRYRFLKNHKYLVAIQNVSGNNLLYLAITMRFCEGVN